MAVEFDPGYAKYTNILSVSITQIYAYLSKFKNFGQRKTQFKLYYPKILKLVENNIAFCFGCLLWAVYLKSLDNEQIINNPCLNDTYDEAETIEEILYSKDYFEQLKKDAKYYLNLEYNINPQYLKILEAYKEFLILNKSFINTKTTTDLQIPLNLKQPKDMKLIKNKIDYVTQSGNLTELFELYGELL